MSIINFIKKELNNESKSINSQIELLLHLSRKNIINFSEPVDSKGTSLGQYVIYTFFSYPYINKIMTKKEKEKFQKNTENLTQKQINFFINDMVQNRIFQQKKETVDKKFDKIVNIFTVIQKKQQDYFFNFIEKDNEDAHLIKYILEENPEFYKNILESLGFAFDNLFFENIKSLMNEKEINFYKNYKSTEEMCLSQLCQSVAEFYKDSIYKVPKLNLEEKTQADLKENIYHLLCLNDKAISFYDKSLLNKENLAGFTPIDYAFIGNKTSVITNLYEKGYKDIFKNPIEKKDVNKNIVNSQKKHIRAIDQDMREKQNNSLFNILLEINLNDITNLIEKNKYSTFEGDTHKLMLGIMSIISSNSNKTIESDFEKINALWSYAFEREPQLVNVQNQQGQTLAHQLVLISKEETKKQVLEGVNKLLDTLNKNGADFNIKDKKNGNPAFFYCIAKQKDLFLTMTEKGNGNILTVNDVNQNMMDFSNIKSNTKFYKTISSLIEKKEMEQNIKNTSSNKKRQNTL